ncbi:DUF624 domain-containing protein [Microbacterium sp. MPKO10]|uniref:DUF624 domain-containing protein n=1 Tax=Microbacterium sp. MPKO10 TaxID=2989818 RepID=UPI002236B6D8|nr:DUF624 domain-containing protein [Microbacterium sp. MPKO10]MCW4457128.1 DUF624 domain-containing protein [Microbacterium sp. MPKO10]
MLKRIPRSFYATLFGTAFLVMGVNALVAALSLPFLVVLMTTDPSLSWPLLAVTAPLCAPALTAAFAVFRQHKEGETQVVTPFFRALRATWRRSLIIGGLVSAAVVVAVADVFVLAPTRFGMAVAPVLIVIALLALATGTVALVATSEAATASLRQVLLVSVTLAVRRWYLTLASLAVVAIQAGIVVAAPAWGIGLTSAACLYVVWAGSRYTVQPALVPAASVVTA